MGVPSEKARDAAYTIKEESDYILNKIDQQDYSQSMFDDLNEAFQNIQQIFVKEMQEREKWQS